MDEKKDEKLIKGYLIALFILSCILLFLETVVPLENHTLLEVSESPLNYIDKTFCFKAEIIDQKIFSNSSFFVLYDSLTVKGKFFNFQKKLNKKEYYFIGKPQIIKEKIEMNIIKISNLQFKLCRG